MHIGGGVDNTERHCKRNHKGVGRMSFIDMIHLFIGIGIGLLFGLAGGVVLARMDDIWKL